MDVAGLVEREELSENKRLSEEGKGKQGERGEKARPQAKWDDFNTCDTFHIISIKFHRPYSYYFYFNASIIQNVIIYLILLLTSSAISK